jgi:AcrR family transcriptional regulator
VRTRADAAQAAASKGEQTRLAILDMALAQAAHLGLEGLSIGALASALGMSKSGVFAHFGSHQELQLAVIREYHQRFSREVFEPALAAPRGLPRLQALFDNWMRLTAVELHKGCLYISGAAEFDDRPGPVRDALYGMVSDWLAAMRRALAITQGEGHLSPDADIEQMLFEIHALILALHHEARFMRSPGSIERARTGFKRVLVCNGAVIDGN